jgi:hypothetical protein
MMSTASRESTITVLHEINLGAHHLFIMSDQSIDLLATEQAPLGAGNVLSLDSCETYRLLLSLQEVFRQGTDQSHVLEGQASTSWDPSPGERL